jgi:putative ABC transport system permease protein
MRLLVKHFAASWATSVLVAALTGLVVLAAALVPRSLAVITAEEFRSGLDAVAPQARDLTAVGVGTPVTVLPPSTAPDADEAEIVAALADWHRLTVTEVYAPMDEALARLRDEQPDTLRVALGPAEYVSRSEAFATNADQPDRDAPLMLTRLSTDPRIEERVRIVEGAFPARLRLDTLDFPLQVMVSVDTADALRWSVGEVRTRAGLEVVLAGTFVPLDDADPYWGHAPSVVEPQILDDGNSTPQVTGVAYVNPLTTLLSASGVRTTVWYPFDVGALDVSDAPELAAALRTLTDKPQLIASGDDRVPGLSLDFVTGVGASLDAVTARAATTTALLALLVSGPLGAAIAVLVLGARAVGERRRPVLALASARGASSLQLRGALALEGAAMGVPPAVVAVVAAGALVPVAVTPIEVIVPALLGFAPAVIFAAVAVPTGLRAVRADLGAARAGRVRWIGEAIVGMLAVAALVLLLRRGLTTAGAGVDPLLAASPLLFCLAVGVVVLRVYPLPLRWLARRWRRRPGLTGFLGSARAVRDGSLTLEAVLALVVALAVGVFSSVLLTTIDRGIVAAAQDTVGADLRASGPVFDGDAVAAAAALDGVAAVSGIDVAAPANVSVDKVRTSLGILVVDAATLAAFRDLPEGLDVARGDAVPIVLSQDVADTLDPDAVLTVEGQPVEVVGTAPRESGYGVTGSWALIDRAFAERITGNGFLPRLLLVDTAADADADAIATALRELGGPATTVTSLTGAIEAARSAPATAGLRAALLVAGALAVLLAGLAILVSGTIGAAGRTRLLGLLRVLGATDRQARGLVVWEFAPPVIAASLAGTALGLALPWLVTAAVDLRPFTGAAEQSVPLADPLLVLGVEAAVLVAVILAVAAAVTLARRTDPTSSLRMGAD